MRIREWLKGLFEMPPRRLRETEESIFTTENEGESESEVDPFNPFPEPVQIEISDVFDLHTIAPRDVRRVVEEYLRQARRAGFRSVRIIHGKGRGVQREVVRTVLARTPFVEDWTDAPPEAGGWGATIAHLSSPEDER